MDFIRCVLLAVALSYCVYTTSSAPSSEVDSKALAEVPNNFRSMMMSKKLSQAYETQLEHLQEIESALRHNLGLISEKKRQLEIKKRAHRECLVSLLACW